MLIRKASGIFQTMYLRIRRQLDSSTRKKNRYPTAIIEKEVEHPWFPVKFVHFHGAWISPKSRASKSVLKRVFDSRIVAKFGYKVIIYNPCFVFCFKDNTTILRQSGVMVGSSCNIPPYPRDSISTDIQSIWAKYKLSQNRNRHHISILFDFGGSFFARHKNQ